MQTGPGAPIRMRQSMPYAQTVICVPISDHAVGGKPEIARCVVGIPARMMNSRSCHAACPTGSGRTARRDKKNDVDMMSRSTTALAPGERLRYVRRLHEPKRIITRVNDLPSGSMLTRSSVATRGGFGDHGQHHVMLVQHLVVLEAVQQRGRRALGVCGEEHGGARNFERLLRLQRLDQAVDRRLQPRASWRRGCANPSPR